MKPWHAAHTALRTAWQQRPVRERRLLALGGGVLLCALLWGLWLMPAWRTWQQGPEKLSQLEAQTRQMLRLQAEARQLQTPQRIDRTQALQQLDKSAQALLGQTAQLSVQGEELRVTLQRASASGLFEWLVQAREKSQSTPRLVQLDKQEAASDTPARKGPASEAPAGPTWSGTLVLRLP
jgi:general secretion pathway protein M